MAACDSARFVSTETVATADASIRDGAHSLLQHTILLHPELHINVCLSSQSPSHPCSYAGLSPGYHRSSSVRVLWQRGCSQGTLWRLAAEAVLEVSEVRGGLGIRELRFHMVEGDFKEFDGRWVVEPGGSGDTPVTTLRYEIALVPKLSIPSAAIVHVVRSGLPANIKAIARRAEEVCSCCQLGVQRVAVCCRCIGQPLHLLPLSCRSLMPLLAAGR